MRHRRFLPSLLLALLATATAASQQQQAATVAIANVTVVDPSLPPRAGQVVLIAGNRISQVAPASDVTIPAGVRIIDGRDKYIIPGLADMHQHSQNGYGPEFNQAERNLRRMLAFGFTTVFSTGHPLADTVSFSTLKKIALADDAPMSRFFGVGNYITVPGGHATEPSFGGGQFANTPEDGRRIVGEMKALGADGIKLIYDAMARPGRAPLPKMRPDVMQAIIDEAHRQGLKAYVHSLDLPSAKEVLAAGADGLVHAVRSAVVDDEFLSLMKARRAAYVTTHGLYRALFDPQGWSRRLQSIDTHHTIPPEVYARFGAMESPIPPAAREAIFGTVRTNAQKVQRAGLLVVAGTDTTVSGVLLGVSSQAELSLLVEDGLTTQEALAAATINAATMLGRQELQGSVNPGKLADLVILNADPLADIGNIRQVYRVVKGGVVYDPAALLSEP
jgi:imidazolonepropionase-like amidohydrolase